MYRLSLIVFGLIQAFCLWGQSPHGENYVVDCRKCHTTGSWDIQMDTFHFNHDTVGFILEGLHQQVDCRSCHETLVFEEAPNDCASCHQDIHSATVGNDCIRCHNAESWLVDEIPEIHERNGFPLLGPHRAADCMDCHETIGELRFDRIGNDCINCHLQEYQMTTSPDHEALGFSTDCASCHDPATQGWGADKVDHNFFPLEGGHDLADCNACHTGDSYAGLSPDCISCHEEDYSSTVQPDHQLQNFSQDCAQCHTLSPGWMPAEFRDHDALYFPIYSGEHQGEWNDCIDCHNNPQDYSQFSCTNCHTNPETDNDHEGVNGYVYSDNACLACHPNGSEDDNFNHASTGFALEGGHFGLECLECHASGFEGTSPFCADCHTPDFEATVNPDHQALGLTNECASCHTTDPGWMPATFANHDDYYPLMGAHALIANDCASCHNGDYTNTPNTCVGCHLEDFNSTSDPDHNASQFSTDCTQCHTEDAWEPSTFDHDAQYFPIYSGEHQGEWSACVDCHTVPGDYTQFSCINCHMNPETDEEHNGVSGYVYEDNACLACHPTGSADDLFDHSSTGFLLEGGHNGVACLECHANGYAGTSPICMDCHTDDFSATSNPNHNQLGLSTDCASCHTTDPGWMPATFANHDDYYPLMGAHALIANDCASCHNGDYINTPNTCVGCHLDDFNSTTDPDHQAAQFSNDCMQCHSEDAWEPSTFDHDAQYFPIYSGEHQGEWSECVDCHTVPGDYSQFSCINCHMNPETDEEHMGVSGYVYQDDACLACHPDGSADMSFDHNSTNFPLTGSHIGLDCIECHANGYAGTSTECVDCHQSDYDGTSNPDHSALALSTDCAACHTTDPGWMPATFPDHDTYYPLTGAHISIASDCMACHNGDYTNTPNSCEGCHMDDYNSSTNPDHQNLSIPTDCASCHTTEPGWSPASFSIHDNYYPLTGEHAAIANDCILCHNGDYTNTPNTCSGCHLNDYNSSTNPDHQNLNLPTDCAQCHTTDPDWMPASFDIHDNFYPLNGAHAAIANDCASCHNGDYNNTPNTCFGCHANDYNGTTNPEHATNNLSTNCTDCHNEDAWIPSNFDHSQYWVLNGAHAAIANDCFACHMGNYTNTPNTCYDCHQTDYDGTTNPDHAAAGFPTDCTSCHDETAWTPANWDHDGMYFPIYSGRHEGEWNACVDCHTTPGDYTMFSCIDCHEHNNQAEVDDDHDGVSGYIYESNACYSCHPTGED